MFNSVRTRVIAAFACVLAVTLVAVAFGSYRLLYQNEHAATDFVGQAAAQICSTSVWYLAYENRDIDPDSERYREARENLRSICCDSGMAYMYAYYCDVDAGTVTYLMCVASDDANDERVARERGYGVVVNVDFSDQQLRTLRGEYVPEARVVDNQYGAMLSWYDKVDVGDNLIAGADYSIGEQRARVVRISVVVIVLIALAMLALLLVQLRVLHTNVFRPLRVIAGQMKEFSAERALTLKPLNIQTHDEMGEIADAFEGMASEINDYLIDIERLTTERVQGQVELDVARRIQLGMVPEHTEASGPGYQVCAIARPARQVGGDFYDCLEFDDGRVAIVIGDVSGKGVAAALFMAMAKTMIRESFSISAGPADALNRANAHLCQANPEGMFVTVFAAVFEPAAGEIRYANAGHVLPLVVGGHVRGVDAEPGTLLGLFDDIELQEGVLSLHEGETLLLFTDGVTEAVSAGGVFLGDGKLVGCLGEHVPYADAGALVEEVVGLVEDFASGCEQFDDLTVIALQSMRRDGEATSVEGESGLASELAAEDNVELAVELASFATMRKAVLASGVDGALARKACLACEEAFANIVSYSGAHGVWFALRIEGGELSIMLADDGAPFDPTAVSVAGKPFEELDGGGMGIGLVRQLTSSMAYRRNGGRNILVLRFIADETLPRSGE